MDLPWISNWMSTKGPVSLPLTILYMNLFSEPSMDLSTYIPNGEWLLKSAPAVRDEHYYKCCPEPYPTVKFYLNLRRRTLFYLFNLILPSLLISTMTLLGFCLPAHDMAEKIGFREFFKKLKIIKH